MALGNTDNNPGNLLANGINWQGLVGTTSANGLGYDVFSTPQYGVRALAVDLKTAIGNGYNTLTTLVAHYLGNPIVGGNIQPTANNPHPQSYLNTVAQTAGLSPDTVLTNANVSGVAQGIIKAEGSSVDSGAFQGGIAMAGLGMQATTSQSQLQSAFGQFTSDFSAGATAIATDPVHALQVYTNTIGAGVQGLITDPLGSINSLSSNFNTGATGIGAAASDTASQAGGGIGSALSGIQKSIAGLFSAQTAQRGTFVVVGIGLLFIGGAILLASSIAKTASNNPGAVAAIAA